jgi:hypothetical protein
MLITVPATLGIATLLAIAFLLACGTVVCRRAGRALSLAELFVIVAFCAVFAALARSAYALVANVLFLAAAFAFAMTRAFAMRETYLRHLAQWVPLACAELGAAFVVVNLLHSITADQPGSGWHAFFALAGLSPLFVGLTALSVSSAVWPIRWPRYSAALCLAFLILATAWLYALSTFTRVNWW